MTSVLFDQRGFRPNSQMYFFQLLPNLLTVRNPSFQKNLKSTNSEFRLKITKGIQFCDEMKKSIAVKAINGKAAFDKVSLNFNLPSFNPNRNIDFNLILLRSQDGGEEEQVGKYTIMSSAYIIQYKDSKKGYYQDNVDMGENFSLSFDLYLDSSRFGLEKLVKQKRDEKRQQNIQNMVDVTKKDQKQNLNTNEARSEALSNSDKVQIVNAEGRFMSPTRKIVRKQSQPRKLLKKQSSPTKSQEENEMKKGLKFLSRNSETGQNLVARTESLAEQQARKLSEKIKQEQQKRQKIIRQKQQADTERKMAEEKKKKDQIIASKMEQAKKDAQRKRLQSQKKTQQQQASKRVEEARKAAENKRLEAQRKRQEQEAERRVEQAREAAQIKRQQIQRKRQEERAKRLEQQRIENQKKILNAKKQENEEKKKEPEQQAHKKARPQDQEGQSLLIKSTQDINQTKKVQKDSKKVANRGSIQVNVKTEGAEKVVKYVFETAALSPVDSEKWNKPAIIKKTGSQLYDKNGNPVKQSVAKQQNNGLKIKVIIGVIVMIVLMMLGSSIMGGGKSKTTSRKKKK